jgi:Fungal specific transcription factor domain
MENRIKWLESIIRERCSNIDLDNSTEGLLQSLDEPPTEDSTQHSLPRTRFSAQATAHDETQDATQESRSHEQLISQPVPITQEEPQQAHEIGLVSLFRGEDPRYIGPSSGYPFAKRIFSNPGSRGRHESVTRTDGIASRFPVELLNSPAALPAQKEVAVELSTKYFETIHLLYPFLHKPTHMEMLDNVYGQEEEDPISIFQVYMVLAIASLNLSRKCKLQLPVEGYYASAMKNADYVCHHGSMAALQCLLLLMVYALYNPSCNINIWNLNYQCLASVIDLGLQRDFRSSSTYPMPLFKQEMRTRVFWVVYTFDRTLCTIMGRPIGIRDEACEIRASQTTSADNLFD